MFHQTLFTKENPQGKKKKKFPHHIYSEIDTYYLFPKIPKGTLAYKGSEKSCKKRKPGEQGLV